VTEWEQAGSELARWLPAQRWFAGKGRGIDGLSVQTVNPLWNGDPAFAQLVVAVDQGGEQTRYSLLLGATGELPERLGHALVGRVGADTFYDAPHDPRLAGALLSWLAAGEGRGGVRFERIGAELEVELPSMVIGAEQSNTSVVFGERYILKLFRRLSPGLNPDLEISRALAGAGCASIVPPLGYVETELDGVATTIGLLQPFLRSATDGWALATTSVRDLYAEGDLHADEVGGDFAAEAVRLGQTTAEVHRVLARVLPARLAPDSEFAASIEQMHRRLDAAVEVAGELAGYQEGLRRAYDEAGQDPGEVPVQRIHGDFHLGQVMRTQDGWVLFDFEGEPARPLAQRAALMSPLRDVAGMLRSFDYAARYLLADQPAAPQLAYRAGEWAERNREAFCDGYALGGGGDPRSRAALLRAFELDKAVYEVVYETRNRPTWLPIPLGSIERLLR
jgi:maltokinase